MTGGWPLVKLGDVLTRCDETVGLDPEREYREITVKLWGRGVVQRGVVTGAVISGQRRYVARAGHFILSRIDARNGALGIVPPELDGAVVSNDFPVFRINEERMSPRYIGWMCRTRAFVAECQRASEGTTNRVRLQEGSFLAREVPLPPMAEQRRVVARIEELADRVEEARGLGQQAANQTEGLLKAELHRRFVTQENSWPVTTVGDVAEIVDPNPSHRMPRYVETGIPFISTVDFQGTEDIRRRTAKHVSEDTYIEQQARCAFTVGDILYSRIGTIGEARVLGEIWCFALSHVLIVVKPKQKVVPRFLLWFLRSDSIVAQATHATRSVGVPDLGIKRIRSFHMPLPTIGEQERIVAEMDALDSSIASLRRAQSEAATELDALLPAILDRAFKGALV